MGNAPCLHEPDKKSYSCIRGATYFKEIQIKKRDMLESTGGGPHFYRNHVRRETPQDAGEHIFQREPDSKRNVEKHGKRPLFFTGAR